MEIKDICSKANNHFENINKLYTEINDLKIQFKSLIRDDEKPMYPTLKDYLQCLQKDEKYIVDLITDCLVQNVILIEDIDKLIQLRKQILEKEQLLSREMNNKFDNINKLKEMVKKLTCVNTNKEEVC